MSSRRPTTTLPIEECPAVAAYVEAEEVLQAHIKTNPEFYETLRALVEDRNAKLEAADKEIRPTLNSCGPFHLDKVTPKIDAEKLYEEVGLEEFQKLGGYKETVVDYRVDRARFLAVVERGDVPDEVKEVVLKVQPAYKAPKPYTLP